MNLGASTHLLKNLKRFIPTTIVINTHVTQHSTIMTKVLFKKVNNFSIHKVLELAASTSVVLILEKLYVDLLAC